MKINRDATGKIIYAMNGKEINPFLSLLATVEINFRSKSPGEIKLSQGSWQLIHEALNKMVDGLPEPKETKKDEPAVTKESK